MGSRHNRTVPLSYQEQEVCVGRYRLLHKWVEVEALANIQDVDRKFVWKNIITRFRVPWALLSDNRLQFDSKTFREYCSNLGIINRFSSPAYPQSNGQGEATNKTIVNSLKKRLEDAKGNWVDELPNILWAYRTTPRRMGETSFSMTVDTRGSRHLIFAMI